MLEEHEIIMLPATAVIVTQKKVQHAQNMRFLNCDQCTPCMLLSFKYHLIVVQLKFGYQMYSQSYATRFEKITSMQHHIIKQG